MDPQNEDSQSISEVYDLTLYLDDHPGGDDVVLAAAGRDATEDFEDAGHSNSAKDLMGAFCIGELDVDTTSPEITSKNQPLDYPQKIKDLTKEYWAVPVAVVGISVVVGFLYLRKK
ncbi:cytochrome b5 isoform X2 [Prunus dulcis]|uniref:cytochrome b5 isoform X2 n=1 Tax=Prunus dulcis TaxID=3755 RepID=UPI0014830C76|nr:cytochrome b5 isoform X2 [Prunus dulcis]